MGFGEEAIHEKVAGGVVTLDIKVIPAGCPEQSAVEVVVFVTWGTGKTWTEKGYELPVHPNAVAVT
ncbi:MAG: hypothetical protein D4R67_12200 [Bacteroidetes bacterium]|nr:MAG: hypothetical protein D4R67_12200 [Bacteroidota bacterium]